MLATLIIGIVQMTGGFIMSRLRRETVIASRKQILWSMLFGIIASTCSILAIVIFTYEDADVGIFTFLATLAIIPGAILGRIRFGERLAKRQILGIAMFVVTTYVFLDFPSREYFLNLPTWIWLSMAMPLLLTANELISKTVRQMNGSAYNFWIGLTTIFVSAVGITILNGWNLIEILPKKFWPISIVNGFLVSAMIWFKIKSYKAGGDIGVKTLSTMLPLLVLVAIFGSIFYGEPFTLGKTLGIFGFVMALSLTDNDIWAFVSKKLGFKKI